MRSLVAILVGFLLVGAFASIASSFGSDPVKTVAPGDAQLAACDPDGVGTSYTSGWDAEANRYGISSVTVRGVSDACDGQSLAVMVADSAGARIATGTLLIPADAKTSFDIPLMPIPPAEGAASVHVVIGS